MGERKVYGLNFFVQKEGEEPRGADLAEAFNRFADTVNLATTAKELGEVVDTLERFRESMEFNHDAQLIGAIGEITRSLRLANDLAEGRRPREEGEEERVDISRWPIQFPSGRIGFPEGGIRI